MIRPMAHSFALDLTRNCALALAALLASPKAPASAPQSDGADSSASRLSSPEAPFLERVETFWHWFKGAERRMHRNMFEAQIVEHSAELQSRIRSVIPHLTWSFGLSLIHI